MPLLISTREDPFYQQRTRLEGRDYVFTFALNEREQRLYLSLADEAEAPIATGLKLLPNVELFHPYRYDPRCPPGALMVVSLSGDLAPPTQLELGEGKRCELLYWSRAELDAIAARQ